ncbi:MAG: LPS O-antigen length regulator [Gammaproteobacteria bacterium]|nr:MAG: LPS O-antigen length regulator [Gammaproteobacteria bacterium]
MNQLEQNANSAIDDQIDLVELFKVFWAHKLMIVVITAMFTVGSVIYAMSLPNIYTAEVTLAPVSSDGNSFAGGLGALGGLASLAGISTSSGGDVPVNIAVIKSRQFIMEFIKENNLLPILFAEKWDSTNNKWLVEDEKQVPSLLKGYEKFSQGVLKITEVKKNGLIVVTIEWFDPKISAKWANLLVNKANAFLKQKAIDEASQSISYLKDQISNTNEVGIQELLYKLIEKELQTTKLANVRKDYAFKVLDPALEPEQKSKPKRKLLVIFGGILGVMANMLLIFIRHFLKSNDDNSAEG